MCTFLFLNGYINPCKERPKNHLRICVRIWDVIGKGTVSQDARQVKRGFCEIFVFAKTFKANVFDIVMDYASTLKPKISTCRSASKECPAYEQLAGWSLAIDLCIVLL